LGVPVAQPFPGVGEVVGEELPPLLVASAIHKGPYEECGPAYKAVEEWIQSHGHVSVGPPREIYLTDPRKRRIRPTTSQRFSSPSRFRINSGEGGTLGEQVSLKGGHPRPESVSTTCATSTPPADRKGSWRGSFPSSISWLPPPAS